MKNITGKILSLLFLFNLFFLQGVNIAEAQHSPVAECSNTHKQLTTAGDFSGTVSILCETDGLDDDHKLMAKFNRLDAMEQPARFFYAIVSFSFPDISAPAVSFRNGLSAYLQQGVSFSQAHCSFLI